MKEVLQALCDWHHMRKSLNRRYHTLSTNTIKDKEFEALLDECNKKDVAYDQKSRECEQLKNRCEHLMKKVELAREDIGDLEAESELQEEEIASLRCLARRIAYVAFTILSSMVITGSILIAQANTGYTHAGDYLQSRICQRYGDHDDDDNYDYDYLASYPSALIRAYQSGLNEMSYEAMDEDVAVVDPHHHYRLDVYIQCSPYDEFNNNIELTLPRVMEQYQTDYAKIGMRFGDRVRELGYVNLASASEAVEFRKYVTAELVTVIASDRTAVTDYLEEAGFSTADFDTSAETLYHYRVYLSAMRPSRAYTYESLGSSLGVDAAIIGAIVTILVSSVVWLISAIVNLINKRSQPEEDDEDEDFDELDADDTTNDDKPEEDDTDQVTSPKVSESE